MLNDPAELVAKCRGPDWIDYRKELRNKLKYELQDKGGRLFRQILNLKEDERRAYLTMVADEYVASLPLSNDFDRSIDNLALKIYEINDRIKAPILHDFKTACIGADLSDKPMVSALLAFCDDESESIDARFRAMSFVTEVVAQSRSQSDRSNAGAAGELIHEVILRAAGGIKGKDYRLQYKSKSGSDTDCVFPAVPDGEDNKVEIYVAVQFSSNDRTRMVTSELKVGAQKWVWTGNGLSVSTKNLKDIGDQILETVRKENIRLICYGIEIKNEKIRLKAKIDKNDKSSVTAANRLDILNSYATTYEEYFLELQRRFRVNQLRY